jgi:hypothetical protein
MKQQTLLYLYRSGYFRHLLAIRLLHLKNTKPLINELLTWSVGALGALGGIYGTYAIRKSKRYQRAEEDGEMIENADKIISMWERLSSAQVTEVKELKEQYKEILTKYNDLRVEFEVEKRNNGFLIEQYKMQLSQKDAEIAIHKTEIENLRLQLGVGVVKQLSKA